MAARTRELVERAEAVMEETREAASVLLRGWWRGPAEEAPDPATAEPREISGYIFTLQNKISAALAARDALEKRLREEGERLDALFLESGVFNARVRSFFERRARTREASLAHYRKMFDFKTGELDVRIALGTLYLEARDALSRDERGALQFSRSDLQARHQALLNRLLLLQRGLAPLLPPLEKQSGSPEGEPDR